MADDSTILELLNSTDLDQLRAEMQRIEQLLNSSQTKQIFDGKSLCVLTPEHPIRKLCIRLMTSKRFTQAVIGMILINCLLLTIGNPNNASPTPLSQFLDIMEYVFTVFFSIELVVKVVAMGFLFGKHAYLRNSWNILDFVVVVGGYLSLLPGINNLSVLRTFRVFRPLRTLTMIPAIRLSVVSLLESLPAMMNIFLLLSFIFIVFGIAAVQLWQGTLSGRCFFDIGGNFTLDTFDERSCALPVSCDPARVNVDSVCGMAWGRSCDPAPLDGILRPRSCRVDTNPCSGFCHFDNIGNAVLTLFTSITLEGWSDTQYRLMDSFGLPIVTAIYFTLLIMLGGFLFMNLAIAVLFDEFDKASTADRKRQADKRSLVMLQKTVRKLQKQLAGSKRNLLAEHESDSEEEEDHSATQRAALARTETQLRVAKMSPPRRAVYKLVQSSLFGNFIVLLIFLNTIQLAMEFHGMSAAYKNALEAASTVFTAAFACEMVLKLVGLGPCGYMSDKLNIFDGLLVLISIAEILVGQLASGGGSNSGVGALRALRLARLSKLATGLPLTRKLLGALLASLNGVGAAALLLLVILFIFSLLGMQLFSGRMPPESRFHFNDQWWAFVTVFQVVSGENWNDVLWSAMEQQPIVSVVFFCLLFVCGNFVILNLFVAVLCTNFDYHNQQEAKKAEIRAQLLAEEQAALADGDSDRSVDTPEEAPPKTVGAPSGTGAKIVPVAAPASLDDGHPPTQSPLSEGKTSSAFPRSTSAPTTTVLAPATSGGAAAASVMSETRPETTSPDSTARRSSSADVVGSMTPGTLPGAVNHASKLTNGTPEVAVAVRDAAVASTPKQRVASLSSETNSCELKESVVQDLRPHTPWAMGVKAWALWATSTPFFENGVLLCIFLSSITVALDEPRVAKCKLLPISDPNNCQHFAFSLVVLNYIFTTIFTIESVMKIIAWGLWFPKPTAYLRSGWNMLDLLIVTNSIISVVLSSLSSVKALRALRSLRTLRPLRVVSRFPGLRMVVNSLFRSLPAISNVALLCMVFFLICGIVGVQLWSGAIASCNDPAVTDFINCTGSFILTNDLCGLLPTPELINNCSFTPAGLPFPRLWESAPNNFDHVGMALLTLFEVATGEMWPDIMYSTVDAIGPNTAMVTQANPLSALYYIIVVVGCSFVMLNLFVMVVIDNFAASKEERNGSALLSGEQREWVETMKLTLSAKPPPRLIQSPTMPFRAACFRVIHSRNFDFCVMAVILVNTIAMALVFYDSPPEWKAALTWANRTFAVIFTLEATIKLLGLGIRNYFWFGWNKFDFILVNLAWFGMAVDVGPLASVMRVLRVARVIRLIRGATGLRKLFKTLLFSLPSLGNVGALLMLAFFTFSVMAMRLFPGVKHGEFLTVHANFDSFGLSVLTMFRMVTGESYNGIMHDCMIQPPYCTPDLNCGSPIIAPIFFTIFFIICNYVLLNLLIAVMLDNFGDTKRLEDSPVTEDHIEAFREAWQSLDPQGTHYLHTSKLPQLLRHTPFPLGLDGVPGVQSERLLAKHAAKVLAELKLPVVEDRVFYNTLLNGLTNRVIPDAEPLPPSVVHQDLLDIMNGVLAKSQRVGKRAKGRRKGGAHVSNAAEFFEMTPSAEDGFTTLAQQQAAEVLQKHLKVKMARRAQQRASAQRESERRRLASGGDKSARSSALSMFRMRTSERPPQQVMPTEAVPAASRTKKPGRKKGSGGRKAGRKTGRRPQPKVP